MNTVDRAVKLLKQHIKALRVIVSAGEINDAFELQRTLASIHQTFLNNGALVSNRFGFGMVSYDTLPVLHGFF
jgi:hypothetical protein